MILRAITIPFNSDLHTGYPLIYGSMSDDEPNVYFGYAYSPTKLYTDADIYVFLRNTNR
jgi:hypothetical protein